MDDQLNRYITYYLLQIYIYIYYINLNCNQAMKIIPHLDWKSKLILIVRMAKQDIIRVWIVAAAGGDTGQLETEKPLHFCGSPFSASRSKLLLHSWNLGDYLLQIGSRGHSPSTRNWLISKSIIFAYVFSVATKM